jgi:exosome complex RNA-binding protein Csl4
VQRVVIYMNGDHITDITGVRPGTPVEVRNYDITHAQPDHLQYDSKGKAYYVRAEYDLIRVG